MNHDAVGALTFLALFDKAGDLRAPGRECENRKRDAGGVHRGHCQSGCDCGTKPSPSTKPTPPRRARTLMVVAAHASADAAHIAGSRSAAK